MTAVALTKFEITYDISFLITEDGKAKFYAEDAKLCGEAQYVSLRDFQFSKQDGVIVIKENKDGQLVPFTGALFLYDREGDTKVELSYRLRNRTPHNGGHIRAEIQVANGQINSCFPVTDDLCNVENYTPGLRIASHDGRNNIYQTEHYIDGKLADDAEILAIGTSLQVIMQQAALRKTIGVLRGLRPRNATDYISGLSQGLDKFISDCETQPITREFDPTAFKGQPVSKQLFAMLKFEA